MTIAILDLAELRELAPPPPVATAPAGWRTSFGSERQTQQVIRVTAGHGSLAALAGTDAVLIQGVKAAAPLRRLFPPREWRLVVSRKLIAQDDPLLRTTASAELPAATAIAVRAIQNLRVTARTLALPLEEPTALATADIPAAATAVRVSDGNRALWLASVALPSACGSGSAPCPARQSLDAWRSSKRGLGEATLIGGRMIGSAASKTDGSLSEHCPSHGIDSDVAWRLLEPAKKDDSPDSATGCISIVRLGG
ncbi:MAG TPA: hypothetical protein VEA77_04145 [Hyphomicrobium sp.]|nr:hypothetical protein [Hyphomicrobium sp.]